MNLQLLHQKLKTFDENQLAELHHELMEICTKRQPESHPDVPRQLSIIETTDSVRGSILQPLLGKANGLEPVWILWQKFLDVLHRDHPVQFKQQLLHTPCIAGVAEDGGKFQDPYECGGIWFECGLSANAIRDRIKKILLHSKIDTGRMKIILRGNPDLEGTMFES